MSLQQSKQCTLCKMVYSVEMGFDVICLKKSKWCRHSLQPTSSRDVSSIGISYSVQQYPTTLDCLWFSDEAQFHLNGFVNKQNTRFCGTEKTKSCGDITPSWEMWCAISKEGLIGLKFVEGTITNQKYLQQLQNEIVQVIQWAGYVNTTFFQQDDACPYRQNVILDILHDVFGIHVPSN